MAMDAEDRAGLYITVIFHLVVVIALLCFQLGAVIRGENTFILDFSKEEKVSARGSMNWSPRAQELR